MRRRGAAPWVGLLAVLGDPEPAPPLPDTVWVAGEPGNNTRLPPRRWLDYGRALQSRSGASGGARPADKERRAQGATVREEGPRGARRGLRASPASAAAGSGDRPRPLWAAWERNSGRCDNSHHFRRALLPIAPLCGLGLEGASLLFFTDPLSLSIVLIFTEVRFYRSWASFLWERKRSCEVRSPPREQGSPGCCRLRLAGLQGHQALVLHSAATRGLPGAVPSASGSQAPETLPSAVPSYGREGPEVPEGQPKACGRRRGGLV